MLSTPIAWKNCIDMISSYVTPEILDTWFRHISPESLDDDILILKMPNKFFIEWVDEHYGQILLTSVKSTFGEKVKIKYIIQEKIQNTDNNPSSHHTISSSAPNSIPEKLIPHLNFIKNNFSDKENISGLNSKYVFSNFIEGDCNQLARSSALSVADKPLNNAFNPLMIYSSVGLGKTHLLNAIGNYIKSKHEDKIVFYMQTTVFVDQFIKSIRNNNSQEFTNFYSKADVILLDDVQFLREKHKTQEILFYIFNQLHQNGKQIVLSSDRAPNELVGLQDRLISRFKWGLTVNLMVPDLETRIAILKSKVTDGLEIDDSIIEYIANRVDSNIRELEGVMITAIANTSLEHNLDINSIQKIINNISSNEVEVDRISYVVAEYFQISIEDILGKSRQKDIALARQIAMYLAKKYTRCSLKKIGTLIGGRDHSTVIHAINNISELIKTEMNIKKMVENINKGIYARIK